MISAPTRQLRRPKPYTGMPRALASQSADTRSATRTRFAWSAAQVQSSPHLTDTTRLSSFLTACTNTCCAHRQGCHGETGQVGASGRASYLLGMAAVLPSAAQPACTAQHAASRADSCPFGYAAGRVDSSEPGDHSTSPAGDTSGPIAAGQHSASACCASRACSSSLSAQRCHAMRLLGARACWYQVDKFAVVRG